MKDSWKKLGEFWIKVLILIPVVSLAIPGMDKGLSEAVLSIAEEELPQLTAPTDSLQDSQAPISPSSGKLMNFPCNKPLSSPMAQDSA